MGKENKIAETELEVMKAIWESDKPLCSSEIVRKLKIRRGWEDTTIYTLISRLVKKGFLLQKKEKKVSSYLPTITKNEYALEQTQDMIDKFFKGDAKELISMLHDNKKIKAKDMESLRDFWEGETKYE